MEKNAILGRDSPQLTLSQRMQGIPTFSNWQHYKTKTRYQEFRPFTVSGHETLSIGKGTLTAKNTGKTAFDTLTVRLSKFLSKGDTLKLFAVSNHPAALLGGGPLNVDYEFVEMHFHWGQVKENNVGGGSEHSIDGHK